MSQSASELCALVIEDVYGQLTSLLFRILVHYGRLSLPALRQHTCLSERLVKHGLSVLIQHQLILWYTSDYRSTFYQANLDVAYSLVRSGKFVKITQDRAGRFASDLVSNLLFLGHASTNDLVQAYGVVDGRSVKGPSNLHGVDDRPQAQELKPDTNEDGTEEITADLIHKTLHKLLDLGFLTRVNISHFRSAADNRIEAEKIVPSVEHYKAKSKKENEAQRELAISKQLDEWEYGLDNRKLEHNGTNIGKKRSREETEDVIPEKRQRLGVNSRQQVNGTVQVEGKSFSGTTRAFEETTTLRINYLKFSVITRNEHFVKLAARCIGSKTSEVYAHVLQALQRDIRRCRKDTSALDQSTQDEDLTSLPQVTTDELISSINGTEELINALGTVDASSVNPAQDGHPKKRRKQEFDSENEAEVNGEASSDENDDYSDSDEDDSAISVDSDDLQAEASYSPTQASSLPVDPHREAIRSHLLLLAGHSYKFLHHFPQTRILPERWSVDFSRLRKKANQDMLMQTITCRYGVPARRIVHILLDQGKVADKELGVESLMNMKPLRNHLTKLHHSGMIQVQEIPRDLGRTSQRTMFLWFFDADRATAKISEESYKTMTRCLQRAQLEGEKVRGTVEKANRSDVKGREEEFLTVQEREALNSWKAVEDRLRGEVARLDEILAIIHDY